MIGACSSSDSSEQEPDGGGNQTDQHDNGQTDQENDDRQQPHKTDEDDSISRGIDRSAYHVPVRRNSDTRDVAWGMHDRGRESPS
jgi:hypothetical protein